MHKYENANELREGASQIEATIKTQISLSLCHCLAIWTKTYPGMNIIKAAFKDLSYTIDSRIKSESHIERKFQKDPSEWKNDISNIPDVLGFRVSIKASEEQFAILKERLAENPPSEDDYDSFSDKYDYIWHRILDIMAEAVFGGLWGNGLIKTKDCSFKDYFLAKGEFKAFILHFKFNGIGVEIQFMSEEMKLWVESTHAQHEQIKYGV